METRNQPDPNTPLPSFSIVIETENLAVTDIAGLEESLDSLAGQQLSPAQAREVIVIESGDVPRGGQAVDWRDRPVRGLGLCL